MKNFILPILAVSLVANVALSFALWTSPAEQDQGGAEAATVAEMSTPEITVVKEPEDMLFPIKGEYWLTSEFGIRVSPFTGKSAIHYGTDYGAPAGAEIQAVKGGVVVTHWPAPDGYYRGHPVMGGYIEILHDDGLSRYAHMSRTFVHEGDRVEAGETIGIIGATGMVAGKTGRHLHVEYLIDAGRAYR